MFLLPAEPGRQNAQERHTKNTLFEKNTNKKKCIFEASLLIAYGLFQMLYNKAELLERQVISITVPVCKNSARLCVA